MIVATLPSNAGLVLKIRMQLPVSLFIGLRYSRSRKGNAFISFISLFSVAGIFLGVMALTVVSSVMNGFEGELKKRILGVIPHVVVTAADDDTERWQPALLAQPLVQQITPFLQTEALVQSPRQLTGVLLQGVTTDAIPDFMQQALLAGDWQQFAAERYVVMLGRMLAEQLQVSVGDQLRFMLPQAGSYTPMGWVPRQRLFTVAGILDTGSDVDKMLAVTNLADLSRLSGSTNAEAQWRITLTEPFAAPHLAQQLAGFIDPGLAVQPDAQQVDTTPAAALPTPGLARLDRQPHVVIGRPHLQRVRRPAIVGCKGDLRPVLQSPLQQPADEEVQLAQTHQRKDVCTHDDIWIAGNSEDCRD